jgi:hypothetical protein
MKLRTFLFSLFHILSTVAYAQSKLIPKHITIQYAGSIGFVSTGPGYTNKNGKVDADFLFGYLPKSIGGDHIFTFTPKVSVNTRPVNIGRVTTLRMLRVGVGLSFTFDKKYAVTLPDHYPKGYYWWSESLRINLNIGSILKVKNLEFYYEFGTNELKLVSYIKNIESLSVVDIMHLGIGGRFKI